MTRQQARHYLKVLKIETWHFMTSLRFFMQRQIIDLASALTYSTLLAIVPILAVVFAIARGFGFNRYIEQWFRDAFSSQPQASEVIIGFVNSYLVHTQSGVFLGIGLVFMLFTVINLTANIEKTFNQIWHVRYPRSIFRTLTDYLSMFFLIPIIIVLTSGLSIFVATLATKTDDFLLLGPMMRLVIMILPFIVMSGIFTGLYVFMPNTKVNFTSAVIPGIIAGTAMQFLQTFYIHAQIFLSSYNAIYGSFAALPLFMLWMHISWTICLFGAELSYTIQNMDYPFKPFEPKRVSHKYNLMLSATIMSKVTKRFIGEQQPYTAVELRKELDIPMALMQELLYTLVSIGMLSTTSQANKDDDLHYQPAMPIKKLTLGILIERIESQGKWNTDFVPHEHLDKHNAEKIIHIRKQYLKTLDTISLAEI